VITLATVHRVARRPGIKIAQVEIVPLSNPRRQIRIATGNVPRIVPEIDALVQDVMEMLGIEIVGRGVLRNVVMVAGTGKVGEWETLGRMEQGFVRQGRPSKNAIMVGNTVEVVGLPMVSGDVPWRIPRGGMRVC